MDNSVSSASILGDLQSFSLENMSMSNIIMIVSAIISLCIFVLLKLKPELAEKIPFMEGFVSKKQVCFMGESCTDSSSSL
jgi:hypothetical protein